MPIKQIKLKVVFLVIVLLVCAGYWYLVQKNTYSISEYLPLHENDVSVYLHHEGVEKGIVKITVKNVQPGPHGTKFDFFWEGKYSDRITTCLLTREGLKLVENKHLVGQVPLKVVRKYSPATMMIPAHFNKTAFSITNHLIYDYDSRFLDQEQIESLVSFVGKEKVTLIAGNFECLHFFIRHLYKNKNGESIHMHTYDFWIAPGAGVVKQIHTFIPFVYIQYISPEDKTINNRYNASFVEVLELIKANIGGKQIGNQTY